MMRSSVWVLGGVKINFLYSGSREDDTMTIMTVIVSSVSESVSDGGGGDSIIGSRAHGNVATPGILAYLHHTSTGISSLSTPYLHTGISTLSTLSTQNLHWHIYIIYTIH